MTINCGSCKGTHPTAAEVRACFEAPPDPIEAVTAFLLNALYGDSGAQAGPEPTERQLDYVSALVKDRPVVEQAFAQHDVKLLTRPQVSTLIDLLVKVPVHPRLVENKRPEGYTDIVELAPVANGTYTVALGDGSHVTLRLRDATWAKDLPEGAQVVEYLSGSDNEWDYTGFAFIVKGKARVWKKYKTESRITAALQFLLSGQVDEAHERFLDLAEAYALASGKCLRCNHKLTVPASLHRGLGPVCAQVEGVA